MPKMYLLGGENILRRDAKEVNHLAFQDAGDAPSILVFPWARASFDKAYLRRKNLVDYFISLGAGEVNFTEYSDNPKEIANKIIDSDLVYLTGGLASVLIERLKKIRVDSLLNNYDGVIVGRSAGALALCKKCVITGRKKTVKIVDGLGFVDFMLKAHYTPLLDEELLELSKEETVYAVPLGSAIVYDKGGLSFIGSVFLFENGKKQILK